MKKIIRQLNNKWFRFKHWLRFRLWWWVEINWNRFINGNEFCPECNHTNKMHIWNDGSSCVGGIDEFCNCGESGGR